MDDSIAEYESKVEEDNTYYLTIPFKNPNNDEFSNGFLYDIAISARGFFKHPIEDITNYILDYSPNYIPETSKVEIVQTKYRYYEKNGFRLTNVLIKTFWLKIVQRRWRNVLKKRQTFIHTYMHNHYKNRDYTRSRVEFPQLRGCLADMR